jgi:hypothetical protein
MIRGVRDNKKSNNKLERSRSKSPSNSKVGLKGIKNNGKNNLKGNAKSNNKVNRSRSKSPERSPNKNNKGGKQSNLNKSKS